MRKSRLRAEVVRLQAELDAARPFLGLAREIRDEVARVAAEGGGADSARVAEAIEAIPTRERDAIARAVFDQLPARDQWAVLGRVFDDDALRRALGAEDDARLVAARRDAARAAVVATVRANAHFDTRLVPTGETLTLVLGREGSRASARRLVLRATDDAGVFQVIEDVFNPDGNYFVTPEYDEATWRAHDRLPAHARIRVGSIVDGTLVPTLVHGGRVDVDVADDHGDVRAGRLHLAAALLGDVNLFATGP